MIDRLKHKMIDILDCNINLSSIQQPFVQLCYERFGLKSSVYWLEFLLVAAQVTKVKCELIQMKLHGTVLILKWPAGWDLGT